MREREIEEEKREKRDEREKRDVRKKDGGSRYLSGQMPYNLK